MKNIKEDLKRFLIALAACGMLVGTLTGCQGTMDGARDDVEEMGDDIEDAVD